MTTTQYTTAVAAVSGAAQGSARRAMIDSQLRTSGVNEPYVLAAMARVAREDFVPAASRDAAYIDRSLPLGNGRFLPAPLVHGKMVQLAAPTEDDKALIVSNGSNYLAEVLRPLVGSLQVVDAAEIDTGMTMAPYSLIIIDGAIEELPEELNNALAADGRIVAGLVNKTVTRLVVGSRVAETVVFAPVGEIAIPALAEFAAPKRWSF
ncbi:MAG: protein-L-isoaspartate O-methyltransferase [Sphingomonadales bacterium]|nr:protein-L-isoaspartate O-methyltransferase [Sphingomonadales bacterium]MDE2170814.1 protein-L-isoaspartate O-methyltransferase [Sphingomonadales bacterium]